VNVYQAMGGGWVDIADSMTPRPVGMVEAKDKKQP
jgi:multidrug efflux system outer membrane protein